VYKGSFFPTSSPIPVGGVFDDGWLEMVSIFSCVF
jgi:hypothetical protein